jgi:phage FluMu protein gp41
VVVYEYGQPTEPTFVVCNRREVIDLTLGTNKIVILLGNWHVSNEPSLSGRRYICFQIGNISINQVTFRNSSRTNWESYKDDPKMNLETLSRRIRMINDIDRSVDQLQRAIVSSYYQNCPDKTTRSPGTTPCWNKNLSWLRNETINHPNENSSYS